MADKFGKAGKSAREMAEKRRLKQLIFLIITIVALIAFNKMHELVGYSSIWAVLLLIAFLIFIKIVDRSSTALKKRERQAIRGAKGEEKVAEILENLGDDFIVAHDIPSPFGNIDHIVLSKEHGVFLIETKSHGGEVKVVNNKVLVNNKMPEKDFIAQVLKNTYWLRNKIGEIIGEKPFITPILVFTNAFVRSRAPVKGIRVINKKYLKA